jgi:hypothetical protein
VFGKRLLFRFAQEVLSWVKNMCLNLFAFVLVEGSPVLNKIKHEKSTSVTLCIAPVCHGTG